MTDLHPSYCQRTPCERHRATGRLRERWLIVGLSVAASVLAGLALEVIKRMTF